MIKINVLVEDKNWKKFLPRPELYFNKKIKNVAKKISLFKKKDFSFTLLLSGDKEIKKLNKKFRKKDSTTDVLSFPFYEKKLLLKLIKNSPNIYLGDIIINHNKIEKQKKKRLFLLNFEKLWVHGLLHLFGHKHKSDKDYLIMQKLENKILKAIK